MDKPIILVVEDNPTQRKVISLLSEEYGFGAVVVGTCAEAVQALEENDVYSLVLMDIRLPDRDGVECSTELRRLLPKDRKIPIIAMTGVTNNSKEWFIEAGMDDYLEKPFTAREFRDMVRKWTLKTQPDGNVYQFPPRDEDKDRFGG